MPLDLFFLGYVRFSCPQDKGAELFELFRANGFSPKGLKRCEKKEEFHFFCSLAAAKRLRQCEVLPLTELKRGGLPVWLGAMVRRPGLLLGALLALAILIVARLFVWSVEIEGNEQVPAEELLSELAAVGLAPGDFIPSIKGDEVALSLRQGDRRIAYATVNFRGTVAYVQVRESVEKLKKPASPADLVAARDGIVTMPLAFEGSCMVREGEVVRAGQVLVSGTVESEKHGPRMTRAAGQILARTTYTYTVSVPFEYQEKVYTGRVGRSYALCFFGFQGFFLKTTGNIKGRCDIIQDTRWATLSGGRILPIGLTCQRAEEYELRDVGRSALEAKEEAFAQLEARLADDCVGKTLLERTVEVQADATGITLLCTVICEEDIARVREAETAQNPS